MDFNLKTLSLILALAVLEVFLSVDNAVVLAIIARDLNPRDQKRALRYGLFGAMVFRFLAILLATHLVRYKWVKVLGGIYLFWITIQYFFLKKEKSNSEEHHSKGFWKAVFKIEMTDLVFAVDSILAAVAMTDQIWIIFLGGILGVIAIRFAASHMINLLKSYPFLEPAAFVLIGIVGLKVIVEAVVHSF